MWKSVVCLTTFLSLSSSQRYYASPRYYTSGEESYEESDGRSGGADHFVPSLGPSSGYYQSAIAEPRSDQHRPHFFFDERIFSSPYYEGPDQPYNNKRYSANIPDFAQNQSPNRYHKERVGPPLGYFHGPPAQKPKRRRTRYRPSAQRRKSYKPRRRTKLSPLYVRDHTRHRSLKE